MLDEVPGALERPSGCRIRVWQSEDGRETTILIPPREAPFWLLLAAFALLVNLLLLFVTGVALFFAHKSILFMTQIAPDGMPPPMRRFAPAFAFAWACLLTLGGAALAAILRPLWLRESLTLGPDGFTRRLSVGRRADRAVIPRSELRGFHLHRDPQGLEPSALAVQGRSVSLPVAEYVTDADREWLASVGNALLRAQ